MSWLGWSVLAICAVAAVLVVCTIERRDQRARAARRERERLDEARLKVTRLVVDFEHTPIRGASRDRSQHGKARRRARRG